MAIAGATVAATGLGAAGAAQAYTASFGPGPAGTGYADQNTTYGQGGFTTEAGDFGYTVPVSIEGCPSFCVTSVAGAASLSGSANTITGGSISGHTVGPFAYHWLNLSYSTASGPSGSIG
jgi:hypothetical protein